MIRKSVPATRNPINVAITEIGAGGDGIGVYQDKQLYAAKTAPGDVALVQIEQSNAQGHTARLLSLETPSPERIVPPCPYFDRCGGCALQHVHEDFYQNWKIEKVRTTLARAGVEPLKWNAPAFLPSATRWRTNVAVTRNKGVLVLGYNEYRSHNIIDIKLCLILKPELDTKLQELRPYLDFLLPQGKSADLSLQYCGGAFDLVLTGAWREKKTFTLDQLETLAALGNELNIARISVRETEFAAPEIVMARSNILKNFDAVQVALPPAAFLQASAEGERTIVSLVQHNAGDFKNAADLFCGCGTFAGALLKHGKVYAADSGAEAIAALASAKHKNLKAEQRDLFKEPLTVAELNIFDLVVLDPPRAGAMAQTQQLAASDVPKIIYVSCNPGSFARDARILQESGYKLMSLTVVDQFVWSAHVEVLGVFTR